MLYRALLAFTPMTVGMLVYSGAVPVADLFVPGYAREVAASGPVVSAALADMEVDGLSKGEAAGFASVVPKVRRQTNPDGYSWFVMSGDQVAMELVVTLAPAKDGAATIVRGDVKSGAAGAGRGPQGVAAMKMLLPTLLDAELADFLPPDQRLPAEELKRKRAEAAGLITAAQVMSNPMAIAMEGRRMQQEIESLDYDGDSASYSAPPPDVSFRPGKPMVDVSR